jgi:tetratricopeptide (TPR) repeat protein
VWSGMNDEYRIETAIGLNNLGMFREAEAELLSIPPSADNYNEALGVLLRIRLALGDYDRAIETGNELLERDGKSRLTAFNTSLALTFAGRHKDARRLMERLPNLGERRPGEAYQMACLESRLGNFEEALIWLESALRRSSSYPAKALVDSDLQPLWQSLVKRHPSLPQAHVLLMPVFDDLRRFTGGGEHDFELDGNDLKQLPEGWRRLFRFTPAVGTHSIHALTAARYPEDHEACLSWHRERVETSLRCLALGREAASAVVLQSQQAYARLHLAAGNYLAARYHLVWALGKNHELLNDFRADDKLRPLTYLFDEIEAAQDVDSEASRFLVEACFPSPVMNVAEILDDVPTELRNTSLYLLRAGRALHDSGDYAAALALWIELCVRWPQDPVGFGNGVTCLMHLGLWERARTLLCRAPRAYRHFHLCRAQCRQLAVRDLKAADAPRSRPFRGQPDLGGLLRNGIPGRHIGRRCPQAI